MASDHHDHGQSAPPAIGSGVAFALGLALNLGFVAVEPALGVLAHSMALLADAGHNLSDVLGLAIAWTATILVRRRPSHRFTYGLRSSSILAALLTAIVLLIAGAGSAVEALTRLAAPEPVASRTVVAVAAIGILINGATALLFSSGRHAALNRRAVVLHMSADAGVSLGVVLAGAAILATGWLWLDAATHLVIGLVIRIGTLPVARDGN